jgi:hypothetical protein
MRGDIDSVGQAADDARTGSGEGGSEQTGDALPVRGRAAAADQRYR